MPLKPPDLPIIRRGRPKIDGKTFNVIFPNELSSRIEEYRNWVKNKTGCYPKFSEAVRGLVDKSLNELGITNESPLDEEDS